MATPLSIHNLINGGWRTVLSIVGISIAIVLIFMQLGFLGAVTDTAVVFYDKMKFDLVACSPDYYNFVDSYRFPREQLSMIESVDGVESVQPLHVSLGKWNYEQQQVQRGILIIGLNPTGTTFTDPDLQKKIARVNQHRAILVDRSSRPRFLGAKNRTGFEDKHVGLQVELNGVACKIVDLFQIGTGLAADGSAIVKEELFYEVIPVANSNSVALGLIQLKSGADPLIIQQRILEKLPKTEMEHSDPHHAVDILTRAEIESRETAFWLTDTPVGFIFFTGVVVAFIVGAIIVYIVLSADISKQMGEYATLKAMGYRNSFLSATVVQQAFVLAVTSYILAFVVSIVLYQVVGNVAKLPIEMTLARQIIVFLSSLLMSFLSAMIAMQKLRQADPADLF